MKVASKMDARDIDRGSSEEGIEMAIFDSLFGFTRRKKTQEIPLSEVQFLGEQDGSPEQELKSELTKQFRVDTRAALSVR